MSKISVLNVKGEKVKDIKLNDNVWSIEPNDAVIYDAICLATASLRQGTHSVKTRSEVSGGGRKPWRQKGTGNARQGSTRSPQWRHGGIVFAPKPRDYSYVINKKVKRLAMKSAFSSKVLDNGIVVLDSLEMPEYKTKSMANVLNAIGANGKSLVVLPEIEDKIIKSSRNIPGVKTSQVNTLNVYDILNARKLVIVKSAISKIEEVYA